MLMLQETFDSSLVWAMQHPWGMYEPEATVIRDDGAIALGASPVFTNGLVTVEFNQATAGTMRLSGPDVMEDPPTGVMPTTDEVSLLLQTRTTTAGSGRAAVFDSTTRPTADQVEALIRQAVPLITGRLVRSPVPVEFYGDARSLVTLQTAVLVEASFYREQIDDNTVEVYNALLDKGVVALNDLLDSSSDGGAIPGQGITTIGVGSAISGCGDGAGSVPRKRYR